MCNPVNQFAWPSILLGLSIALFCSFQQPDEKLANKASVKVELVKKIDSLQAILDTIPDSKAQLKYIAKRIAEIDYVGPESEALLSLGYSITEDGKYEFGYNKMIYLEAISKYRVGEFAAADSILLKCFDYYSIDNWAYSYLGARSLQGILLRKQKDYYQSLNIILSTISEAEELIPVFEPQGEFVKKDIINNLSNLYNDAGNLYQEIDDLDNAIVYMRKSAETDFELGEERAYGISLSNLGSILNDAGKLEEAKDVLGQAYAIKKKINRKVSTALTEINLAENALAREDYNSALNYVEKCKAVFEKVGYKEAVGVALVNEGKVMQGLKKYQAAIVNYQDALKIIDEIGTSENREKVLAGLYQCYSRVGNAKQALAYHEAYVEELDERKNVELTRQLTLKQAGWDYDKRLSLVQLENEKNDAIAKSRIERLAKWRNSLIFGLLGLAAITILLFRSSKAKSRFNAELTEKNSIIKKSLSEKELLLKEIHHRVKNNLQVISSLLSLQSDYIKDDAALNAIKEGRDRVKSMALIHQNLYREENLTGIEVRQYFEKLTRSLFNSYNIRTEQIKLDMHIEDINLDVDTIIPLGLVVNELITNALKYAFPDNRSGQITMALRETNNELILQVSDNGVGFDATEVEEEGHSFGYQIIRAFQEKLDADLSVDASKGTTVQFVMREYQVA